MWAVVVRARLLAYNQPEAVSTGSQQQRHLTPTDFTLVSAVAHCLYLQYRMAGENVTVTVLRKGNTDPAPISIFLHPEDSGAPVVST